MGQLQGMSVREFAKRDGCSRTLVQRAIKSGHLQAFDDGSISPDLVGTGWRRTNRRAVADAPPAEGGTGMQLSHVGVPSLDAALARMSQAEAERVKEVYLALLRQLEYDQKSAQVALVGDAIAMVAAEYSKVRARLMALPAEIAPRLAGMRSPSEAQAVVEAAVVRALRDLSIEASGGSPPALLNEEAMLCLRSDA